MEFTRYFIIDDDGNSYGLAQLVDFDVDLALENAILEEEENLTIPDPYPEDSIAFFTEKGMEQHKDLVDLWTENVMLQDYVVRKMVVEINDKVNILYQDESQILIHKDSFTNVKILNKEVIKTQ